MSLTLLQCVLIVVVECVTPGARHGQTERIKNPGGKTECLGRDHIRIGEKNDMFQTGYSLGDIDQWFHQFVDAASSTI